MDLARTHDAVQLLNAQSTVQNAQRALGRLSLILVSSENGAATLPTLISEMSLVIISVVMYIAAQLLAFRQQRGESPHT